MTKSLVDSLSQSEGEAFIIALVRAEIAASEQSMGTSFKKAADVVESLSHVNWELLEAVLKLQDERQAAAQAIWTSLRQAFQADELAVAMGPALADAQSRAVKLLADIAKSTPPGGFSSSPTSPARPASGDPTGPPATAAVPIAYQSKYSHLGSDESEITEFYKGNSAAFERNRRLVAQLKTLYGMSQVAGDSLPKDLPANRVRDVLEVHLIRGLSEGDADERSNMIVVTPTLHTLFHLDEESKIDLGKGEVTLFGVRITLRVDPNHNG
jgi:hypothetical protein